MIEIIDMNFQYGKNEKHTELDDFLANGYQIIAHSTYWDGDEHCERFTLHKPDRPAAIEENQGALVMTTITMIQRDETKNNQRPMWRCTTATGEKVNIFLNVDDPSKDNFHLFEDAGWADFLMEIFLYAQAQAEIYVALRKDGQWWNIVAVNPAKAGIDGYEVPSEADSDNGDEDES